MQAVIIEVALNGGLPKEVNPHVPRTPDEVAQDAIACIDAGAAIIHNHTDDPVIGGSGRHDAQPYLQAWRQILAARPDTLLYPTMGNGGPHVAIEDRYAHIVTLAEAGLLAQGLVDPGSTNFGRLDQQGLPRPDDIVYQNTYRDAVYMVETCRRLDVGMSISIFEPGFLHIILAYHRAGKLPRGSLVKLYFGAGKLLFGLPPTEAALNAYLDMLKGTGLPWLVSAQGGDVVACGLAKLAILRGGHVQVGLEPSGDSRRTNVELVHEVVALARSLGRPIADSRTAAQLLGLRAR
ncbi:3-keto-5-aminohexanoate cleavage protein [Rhodoferax sp. UBA5149]|uniref:3-keto-5-aminohexanoate cleavage protein n=1 Tax=Rhodoferax sp. UBA5149 TaxID=1947379 RepID=UPI0025D10D59|nr:3-keto-5-aminohexanoate cleavage protein [Rhodoferax sp. UBA5149]